ncbi:hypothetical protein [Meiothermus taiwanensis]|uniref:Uncharacterized protein n=1 Tax=Meiothermus taiwanensis TaxID=172827 RepID=A0A399E368_9DEIN|nr:hypothetical protein [Meiothermus taiwanensis]KIQ55143.1 hypothetical protein SY28_04885 [Meiothermus taiwanensis]KZK15673.1 hypothetical protein A3962_09170 [Meiothermus taiwanensis]RIH79144.1 hypothetical protein Mcate_00495 [Meiothermus taiwanensis]
MARWLILALTGFLLFLALAGWAAYAFLIRPAQTLVNDFRQIIALDNKVERQTAYTPPANGELSTDQVQRFVQVQRYVKQQLGERYRRVEARLNQLANQQVGQLVLDYRTALDLFREGGSLVLDAKGIQVQALNQQGFSLEEYAWVRAQVYAALGYGVPNLNPQEILRQIGSRDFNPRVNLFKPEAPAANVRLVEPYRDELVSYYPFTWFGL